MTLFIMYHIIPLGQYTHETKTHSLRLKNIIIRDKWDIFLSHCPTTENHIFRHNVKLLKINVGKKFLKILNFKNKF